MTQTTGLHRCENCQNVWEAAKVASLAPTSCATCHAPVVFEHVATYPGVRLAWWRCEEGHGTGREVPAGDVPTGTCPVCDGLCYEVKQ